MRLESRLAAAFAARAATLRAEIAEPLARIAAGSVKDAGGPAKHDICAVLAARRRIAVYEDLAAWLAPEDGGAA